MRAEKSKKLYLPKTSEKFDVVMCRIGTESEIKLNPFQPSVAFHIETSHLICSVKQMTGCYTKRKTGLKWVN